MDENEEVTEPQEAPPPDVTCSGGITLPSLAVLFGQRPPAAEQDEG